ncbi:hypothetical protein [Rhodopirellula baltica]
MFSLAWAKISRPLLLLIGGLNGAGVVENHGDGDRIAASIGVRILWQKSGFWPRGAVEAGVPDFWWWLASDRSSPAPRRACSKMNCAWPPLGPPETIIIADAMGRPASLRESSFVLGVRGLGAGVRRVGSFPAFAMCGSVVRKLSLVSKSENRLRFGGWFAADGFLDGPAELSENPPGAGLVARRSRRRLTRGEF